jgi:hypothetical protein
VFTDPGKGVDVHYATVQFTGPGGQGTEQLIEKLQYAVNVLNISLYIELTSPVALGNRASNQNDFDSASD